MNEPFADEPSQIVDRSTLERYAVCPHQARLIDSGQVSSSSLDTDAGQAVHDVISEAVRLRHVDGLDPSELRYLIERRAAEARPDIQPAVVAALRQAYKLVSLICYHETLSERSPADILRYDGGAGDFKGQVAADLIPAVDGNPALRLTAELDFLIATASAQELELIDWKSGWTTWTGTDVRDSFQFQSYGWLVMANYPECRRVSVRVHMTREGYATSPVTFVRERDFEPIRQRLITAALTYRAHANAPPEAAPAWPAPERCGLCPAAQRCKCAHEPGSDLAKAPEGYLRQYVSLKAITDKMHDAMTAKVRDSGKDIVFGDVAFGTNKPKQQRAPACDSYTPKR